ncbi:4'-phosphopantetheinyl transferase superfamily protein [Hymenobacter sp. H14-R3]|uniref:4'-phosphopantetheinyl transferase family protein n=1 Tax=Hymenobacter sp. H14-R3 TaxID=3046308 RepID=UPI0024BB0ECA|nr:4'-phosphopantetheinyl transferase superfamily protein [Hymenobacter sp. H14-R3]MDJ0364651.1 4'-phosphopantetheinyl transferase superfamily protein [Hymenobacter sp. H14-R3]
MGPFLHIWQADLATDHPGWPAAETTLSAAELARLARLRSPALRQTYGRAHGFLRSVLSNYNTLTDKELLLNPDANGKPQLAAGGLHFNLSYRPGRALLAVSNAGPVGADVEPLTPLADAAALVQELFSASEQAALRAAAPADYWPLFYLIWTRKEAYAKALGMGLGMPFAAFSVLEFRPGAPPALSAPAGCRLLSFSVGIDYQGAIATLGSRAEPAIQHFSYPIDL